MPPFAKRVVVTLGLFGVLALLVHPIIKPELQRARFQSNLKSRATPQQLQAWAMGVLEAQDTHIPSDGGAVTNLLPAFRGLFANAPDVYWYSGSQEDTAFVRVTYGGAGGHWGVELGPTNRPTPKSLQGRQYTPWAPGACFFNGQ